MYGIEIMVKEHDNILKFNKVVRSTCLGILNGGEPCIEDFRTIIDFVRNYADKHHHGKEEKILFKEMQLRLGNIGANLITHGMLVEHDLNRLFILELENSLNKYSESKSQDDKLDIIANAISYTKLLERHIDKENNLVYTYGEKNLSSDILKSVDERTKTFEEDAEEKGVQDKYLKILNNLYEKYIKE
jgi:hemerythrin-like domain-containing protein